ncbi:Serine/threonine-protein kinase CTR1 [Acorus calamus]|uniref:non-specific serine/threonine protein kinase n=1 Tax=Acorus calamus TaxID=4465 RepID=A0AAV9DGQ7_ACOCL|nr:Serine/threonine-protein kinase CTR1 [Acorus calamus]
MEMNGRRSSYALLGQYPDDNRPLPDWTDVGDHRGGGGIRIVGGGSSIGLQRQSSGSSFGESSISGEYYIPATLSTVAVAEVATDVKASVADGGGGGSSGSRSWAQQAEESYQLQLALALRLSMEASRADDPDFMEAGPSDQMPSMHHASVESVAHRFWVNGCLSYHDKVPDGFYQIHGMDPYVWTICSSVQEDNWIPSIESLKAIQPIDSSVEVVLINKQDDPELRDLQDRVVGLSRSCNTTEDAVDQLAKLICTRMGGAASSGEDSLVPLWKASNEALKAVSGSVVIPVGKLSAGLCRHRAVLFKVLADAVDLPCRVAKGCKYCNRDDASSCLVQFGPNRECLVDLIGNPGSLSEPDSLLNGPSSISISSPLRLPKFKSVEVIDDFRSLAKQYFLECQFQNLLCSDLSAGTTVDVEEATAQALCNNIPRKHAESDCLLHTSNKDDISSPPPPHIQGVPWTNQDARTQLQKLHNHLENVTSSKQFVDHPVPLKYIQPRDHRDVQPILAFPDPRADVSKDLRLLEGLPNKSINDMPLAVDDLNIPWGELVLKERIGAGSFGTVHRADWHGSDVAVKILMEKDFHPEWFKEFVREVAIMKSLRHPNIVLFMGAVTQPPNLSIVTEYLSRGSLYRLLRRPGVRELLDERRRLNMAYDVAKGMNYLHRRNPPIVHRDLKSPNLLVDKKYTVKVCDFGLSRLKANTFLSSKSAAGTPEWMAPEVLRDEQSNEKSDVYSFGVILWELMTVQQPWSNLNPAQVVAAVGFKGRRLDIPSDVNPQVAALIESCWANEPWRRPSFSSIMESLRPLIKPVHAEMKRLA